MGRQKSVGIKNHLNAIMASKTVVEKNFFKKIMRLFDGVEVLRNDVTLHLMFCCGHVFYIINVKAKYLKTTNQIPPNLKFPIQQKIVSIR